MAQFTGRLVKWGNSVGVSLPKPIRDSLKLKAGDEIEIVDTDNMIILKKKAEKSL